MVFVVFSIDGKQGVQLIPDTVYRIGRRLGVEFYIDDESIELVHAWIGVRADGVVRLSAVAGKTYVKESETEVVSISESDTVNDLVMLRFGNIKANLCFKRELEAETKPCVGGYDVELKSKSTDTTPDISLISSSNTSVDGESFFIPETQAVSFIRTSKGNDPPNISLDEDLLIPETQDILITNPAIQYQHNVNDTSCKDDESDLGTQVRICTQDFYEMDKDAIDDFDSSLLINDGRRITNKPCMQEEEKARTDPKKSALNLWTTPEHTLTELDDVACTPDFLNVLQTLGTPDDTPAEPVDNSEDYIETQVFSMGKLSYENSNVQDIITTQKFNSFKNKQRSDFDSNNEDFIETQVFPGERLQLSRQIDVTNNPQDFIETSAFENQVLSSKPTPKETHHTVLNVSALIHTTAEDMIETQVFIRPADNNIITHSDSININDELDKDLKKLIDISSMPSSPSDVDEYNKRLTIINEQKNHFVGDKFNGNICSLEEVTNLVKKREEEVDKKKHIRAEQKSPVRVVKTHRKRSILQNSVTSEACKKNKKREVKEVLRLTVGESSTQCSKKLTSDAVCKSELSRLEFLKDVNAYLKKIKKSGRKIQLALSRCNLAELQITLFSLQNAFEVADKPEKCDVLIMDKGERTFKFLLGVASSKPLLSSRWLLSVKETRSIDVKPEHIFNDDKFERIYKFEPLYIMNKPYLLKGLNFLLGSSIQPSAKDMKVIIQSAGGSVHSKAALITNKAPIYVVVEQQDQHFEKQLRNNNNVRYIKTEAIMQALVQHRVDQLDERKFQLPMKNS